jgi:hypothetical protein
MDTSSIVATLTSLLAIGLSAALVRVLRQDRQRSDARVLMLASLASAPARAGAGAADAPLLRLEPRARASARAPRAQGATTALTATMAPTATTAPSLTTADIDIIRDRGVAGPATTATAGDPAPQLFEPAPAGSRHALLYIFVAAVVMAALILAAFRWALPSAGLATDETTAAIAAPSTAGPLSLVSLRHEQHADGTLVISGVVRNPVGSAARQGLFAAASLLDAEGALIATARAPLDFTTLAPGDESPFVVRVAGANGVTRYRVGFRDASGVSVTHVDKR